jgi:hypothetical protein
MFYFWKPNKIQIIFLSLHLLNQFQLLFLSLSLNVLIVSMYDM